MRSKLQWRPARVIAIESPAEDVRAVTFAVAGLESGFDPGSHTNIRVTIDGQPALRTYTVIPSASGTLKIAVKLHPNSRGGSAYIWSLGIGDTTEMTEPENRFELSWRASHYLLIAGGIGVTPIYGMVQALVARGLSLRLIYGARSRAQMAFIDELQAMAADKMDLFINDEGRGFDLPTEFARLPADGEAYICGPIGLLEAAKAAWQASGRPMSRLRFEVFGDSGQFLEQPFQVEIPSLGRVVDVRADQSLLQALLLSKVDMVYDCERGECGLCAIDVLASDSEIDHRDVFFSAAERSENNRMCACVSRLRGGKAIVDTGYRNAT